MLITFSSGNNNPNNKLKNIKMIPILLGVKPTNKFLIKGVNISNPGVLPPNNIKELKVGWFLMKGNLTKANAIIKANKGKQNKKFAPFFSVNNANNNQIAATPKLSSIGFSHLLAIK